MGRIAEHFRRELSDGTVQGQELLGGHVIVPSSLDHNRGHPIALRGILGWPSTVIRVLGKIYMVERWFWF
jgi:hypothetical protein